MESKTELKQSKEEKKISEIQRISSASNEAEKLSNIN